MKVAFIHYHLKPGGVTTVIRQQVEALKERCETLVLTGEPIDSPFPCETSIIQGLGYDGTFPETMIPEDVVDSITRSIRSKWQNGCDLIHVHNPTIAKNRLFLKILAALQKEGLNLFLQIHDFAEDGRPSVYFYEDYPHDCHYGVINSRDFELLRLAGLSKRGLHKISNMINPLIPDCSSNRFTKNRVLYPIRGLRRKNIGEAILLSLFFKDTGTLCLTLPPNSPADIESYDGWKTYVKKNGLNIQFEMGMRYSFTDLIRSSKFLITTSISEGFGFSFLEPWTARKMLWGRNLPEISRDFEKNGIMLDHLYQRFSVPIEWIGKERWLERWKSCVDSISHKYKIAIDGEKIAHAFTKTVADDTIDFGLLDEAFQKQIISRVLSSLEAKDALIVLNPFLLRLGDLSDSAGLIETNRNAVFQHYNKTAYGQRLVDIYSRVDKEPVHQKIDKTTLLRLFLNLEAISLLKWSDYAG